MKLNKYTCPCCNTSAHPQLSVNVPEPIGTWGMYIATYYVCPIGKEHYVDEKLSKINMEAMQRVGEKKEKSTEG